MRDAGQPSEFGVNFVIKMVRYLYSYSLLTFPPVYLFVRYLVIAALPFSAVTVMPGLIGGVVQTGPRQ